MRGDWLLVSCCLAYRQRQTDFYADESARCDHNLSQQQAMQAPSTLHNDNVFAFLCQNGHTTQSRAVFLTSIGSLCEQFTPSNDPNFSVSQSLQLDKRFQCIDLQIPGKSKVYALLPQDPTQTMPFTGDGHELVEGFRAKQVQAVPELNSVSEGSRTLLTAVCSGANFECSSAQQLVRALGMRRCFDDALRLLHQLQWKGLREARNWLACSSTITQPCVDAWQECLQLQCCKGALLQGAGRYEQAEEAFSCAASFQFQPLDLSRFAEGTRLTVANIATAAAHVAAAVSGTGIARNLMKQLQQQYPLPLAQHCYALSLLLKAAALSLPLRHVSQPPRPFPQRELDNLKQLWQRLDSNAHERTLPAQKHRLLCFASCAASVAVQLSIADSHSGIGSRCSQVLAARVLWRCFSVRGAHAILSTCVPPPQFDCA
jgi:hypothetical protein